MTLNLYEIAAEYRALADNLLASDLPDDVIRDTLEGESGALEEKVRNIAFMVRELEVQADAAKAEAKRIAEIAASHSRAAGRLMEWLKYGLETAKVEEVKAGPYTVKLKANQPSVVVDDAATIPLEFMRIVPESREPNKAEIAKAIKAGKSIAGCHLEQKIVVIIK